MSETEPDNATAVRLQARVEWLDTDASGTFHHGAIIRWLEAAEIRLYEQTGIDHLFGSAPRVHYDVDYRSTAYFNDEIETHLYIERLGQTSITFGFEIGCDNVVIATGHLVIVNAPDNQQAVPWPREITTRLKPH